MPVCILLNQLQILTEQMLNSFCEQLEKYQPHYRKLWHAMSRPSAVPTEQTLEYYCDTVSGLQYKALHIIHFDSIILFMKLTKSHVKYYVLLIYGSQMWFISLVLQHLKNNTSPFLFGLHLHSYIYIHSLTGLCSELDLSGVFVWVYIFTSDQTTDIHWG